MSDNWRIERELINLIVVISGDYADFSIVARRTADDGLIVDGAGQNEAVVIIGMFADQVYATRRLNNMGAG